MSYLKKCDLLQLGDLCLQESACNLPFRVKCHTNYSSFLDSAFWDSKLFACPERGQQVVRQPMSLDRSDDDSVAEVPLTATFRPPAPHLELKLVV